MAIGRSPFDSANDKIDLARLKVSNFLENPYFQKYKNEWIKNAIRRTLVAKPENRIDMRGLCELAKIPYVDREQPSYPTGANYLDLDFTES